MKMNQSECNDDNLIQLEYLNKRIDSINQNKTK